MGDLGGPSQMEGPVGTSGVQDLTTEWEEMWLHAGQAPVVLL